MDIDQESLSLRSAGWAMYDQITRKYYQKMSYRHWTQSFARFVQESYARFNETDVDYEAPDFTGWEPQDPDLSYFE